MLQSAWNGRPFSSIGTHLQGTASPRPGGHTVHRSQTSAPPSENLPFSHAVHTSAPMLPWNFPASQSLHLSSGVSEYLRFQHNMRHSKRAVAANSARLTPSFGYGPRKAWKRAISKAEPLVSRTECYKAL